MVFQDFTNLWLAEEREAYRHYLQMAEPMIVMESAFDLKGRNLKLAEKSRMIIPALAHEELVALYCMHRYLIYSMWFSLYDSVSYCVAYCFLVNFSIFFFTT